MNIRPLHDRVLVKRLAAEDKSSGGLFIPDTAKEKPLEALVIPSSAATPGMHDAMGGMGM